VEELQTHIQTLQASIASSATSDVRADVGSLDLSTLPTSTRSRAGAVADYKAEVLAGAAN